MRGRKNKISDSETFENSELSGTQFENIETSESENNDFNDLIENFQEMGLELYQFGVGNLKWCICKLFKSEYREIVNVFAVKK